MFVLNARNLMSNIQIDVVYERQWSSLGNLIHALSQMQVMGHFYGGFPKYRYMKSIILDYLFSNHVKAIP